MPSKQEALYRTMHNSLPAYRNNNQGIIRLKHWLNALQDIPASILEVGCGNGKLCKLLADMGYDVTGLDIVKGPYERKYPFVLHDIEKGRLPFKENTFDVCMSFDVLEHLHMRWSEYHVWDMARVSNYIIGTVACFGHGELHQNVKNPVTWMDIISRQAGRDMEFQVFEEQKGQTLLFYPKKEN